MRGITSRRRASPSPARIRTAYPTFLFRMLTTPELHDGGTQREEIIEDWARILDEEVAAEQQARAEAALYGSGGIYDERLLGVRERMFDVLESHVNAVDRELELLYRYSARLVEMRPLTQKRVIPFIAAEPLSGR